MSENDSIIAVQAGSRCLRPVSRASQDSLVAVLYFGTLMFFYVISQTKQPGRCYPIVKENRRFFPLYEEYSENDVPKWLISKMSNFHSPSEAK